MERLTERYKDPIANTVLIKECGDKLCKNICDDIEYDCSKCELEKVNIAAQSVHMTATDVHFTNIARNASWDAREIRAR